MKNIKKTILIAGVSLLIGVNAYAQYPEDFTKDQADSTIKFRTAEVAGLRDQVATTQAQAQKAASDVQQRMADNTQCRDALYAMLGSDRNGNNAYREQISRDEQELAALRQMNNGQLNDSKARVDALEAQIRDLRDMITLCRTLDLKPEKGRRKDFKKIDTLLEELHLMIKAW